MHHTNAVEVTRVPSAQLVTAPVLSSPLPSQLHTYCGERSDKEVTGLLDGCRETRLWSVLSTHAEKACRDHGEQNKDHGIRSFLPIPCVTCPADALTGLPLLMPQPSRLASLASWPQIKKQPQRHKHYS